MKRRDCFRDRSSGQRRYDRSILARLAVLKRAKDCGFTLDEARQLFNDQGRPRKRWERVAVKKMAELDELMQKIAGMKNLLEKRCRCADLEECGRRILEACAGQLAAGRRPCEPVAGRSA